MQHWLEDQSDEGRNQIVAGAQPAPAPAPWRAWLAGSGWTVPAAAFAVVAGAVLAWGLARPAPQAALAIPPEGVEQARGALTRAGIRFERRDGALWVEAADAGRAAAVAVPRAESNAVAAALEDGSVFATGEASRGRRTAATIRTLESTIAMQPGVARASVVLGDAPRSLGPGAAAAASASVTVAMRSGPMPQDLVDAVGVLVAGACPGLRPESVSIIDAGSGRVRTVRSADERASIESSRRREERVQALVEAALGDIPGARVRVTEGESGALVTLVEIPQSYAIARAGESHGGSLPAFVEEERARIADRVEPLIAHASACAVTVSVAADPGWERVAVDVPEEGYSVAAPAASTVAGDMARERAQPLGSPSGGGIPSAWIAVLAGGAAVAAWWAWRRPRASSPDPAGGSAEEEAMPSFDDDPLPGADASDAVRAAVPGAASVVQAWMDRGDVGLAARLVVALDADAASALLRALPVAQVQDLTEALGGLDGPSHEQLAGAVEAFLSEMGQGDVAEYRVAEEAA